MMMKMKQQHLFITLSFFLLFFLHCSRPTLAQGPAAAPAPPVPTKAAAPALAPAPPVPTTAAAPALAPAPPGPTDVTKILAKAGQFTTFIRLMKSTQVANQLLGQLNNTNNGLTIFAPTDSAFSGLESGTLNALNTEQQAELVQFHIVPDFLTSSQFQTVSNPVRTQAGDSGDGKFPLNIITSGNSVNISSGLTNTSISGTVYTDGQLAIYQIDQVLRPYQIFDPQPPAPAPAPTKSKKTKTAADDSPDDTTPADNSNAVSLTTMHKVVLGGVSAIVVALSL